SGVSTPPASPARQCSVNDRDPAPERVPGEVQALLASSSGGSAAAHGKRLLEELESQVPVALLLVDLGHGREGGDDVPVGNRRLLDRQLVELESAGDVALLPEDVCDSCVRAGSILRCSRVEARHDAEQELSRLVRLAESRKGACSLDREHRSL